MAARYVRAVRGTRRLRGTERNHQLTVERKLCAHRVVEAGVDRARRQCHQPHAAAGVLGGDGPRERHHVGLARIVGRLVGSGHQAAERGYVEDAAGTPRQHFRESMTREPR